MLLSFKCKETANIFYRRSFKRFSFEVARLARKKLLMIHSATELNSHRIPPGNRLEKLKGDWEGSHSIRINDQWRICFCWIDGNAYDVQIVDYH
jgi:proteic killer suppression protein